MTAKNETKTEKKIERQYIIPLREKCRPVPRYKKTNKAIKTIKEFLARHMKIRDRDLNKIKLDKYLNEAVWARGIKNPPSKIKVTAVIENGIVRAELAEFSEKLKFKKIKEEKREQKAAEAGTKKKTLLEKAKKAKEESEKPASEEEKEKKNQESEKKSAVIEAGKQMEKAAAKQMKHQVGGKTKEPKHKIRKALAK